MSATQINEFSPVAPARLTKWFTGCSDCLGTPCDCSEADKAKRRLVARLYFGRYQAKYSRTLRNARLARARTFRRPSRATLAATAIQRVVRGTRARRDVMTHRLLHDVPAFVTCNVCNSREPRDMVDDMGQMIHYSGCPNNLYERSGLRCFCGHMFCTSRECYPRAVEAYRNENKIVIVPV